MIPRNYLHIREDNKGTWLKIHYHNSSNYLFYEDEKEAAFSISEQKYSLLLYLDKINRFHPTEYEFLLEYPGHEGYNWWIQTKNPTESHINDDIGYIQKNASWTGAYWNGLYYDDKKYTYLTGSRYEDFWHYAIGSYKSNVDDNTIPGPRIDLSDKYEEQIRIQVKEVFLWIRIADASHPLLYISTCKMNNPFIFPISLLFVFICIKQ